MPYLNKIILVGHVGKEPSVRYGKSGNAVCDFSLATADGYGENKKTNWHRIICFKKTAEFVGEYGLKGSLAIIEGHLQYSQWEDKDGNKRESTEIVAHNVQLVKSEGDSPHNQETKKVQGDDFVDSDIPF